MSGPDAPPCTVSLSPGDDLTPHLVDGAVICLREGVHQASLRVGANVTLRGEPGAILDAGGRGPVVRVDKDQLEVTVQDLVLRNGAHQAGSGVVVDAYATVKLVGCTIEGNQPDEGGGNGLRVTRGWVTVVDTTVGPSDGVVVSTTAEVDFTGGELQGDLRVLDGAKVRLEGTTVRGKLLLRGTRTRKPTLTLKGAEVPGLDNDSPHPGTVVRE